MMHCRTSCRPVSRAGGAAGAPRPLLPPVSRWFLRGTVTEKTANPASPPTASWCAPPRPPVPAVSIEKGKNKVRPTLVAVVVVAMVVVAVVVVTVVAWPSSLWPWSSWKRPSPWSWCREGGHGHGHGRGGGRRGGRDVVVARRHQRRTQFVATAGRTFPLVRWDRFAGPVFSNELLVAPGAMGGGAVDVGHCEWRVGEAVLGRKNPCRERSWD